MTDDVVRRLRLRHRPQYPTCVVDWQLVLDAIRWIEQQEAEIARLRGLITQMVDAYDLRMDGVISADDYLAVLDLLREEDRRD